MSKNKFSFWCPVEFNKAVDETTGEEIMVLGGIASTADEDSDGEFLDPKGFDIKPLMKSGFVNWHHQAKTCPATIVGEPIKGEIRKDGLYLEVRLYNHSEIANDIYALAQTLESDSKTRRLGFSIEGKVVKRKSNNPTDPDYKKIDKAIITGVAITHQPKNAKTFANIIKGDIDDELDGDTDDKTEEIAEETKGKDKDMKAAMDTSNAAAVVPASVDDKLKNQEYCSKSEVFERIFHDIPGISIAKAEKIYSLIKNISKMNKDSNVITPDDVQKAYETLGLEFDAEKDIIKGEETTDEETDDIDNEETDDAAEETEKANDTDDVVFEDDEDTDDEDSDDEPSSDDEDKDMKKGNTDSFEQAFERIEKAISHSTMSSARYIKALGVLVKAQSDDIAKAQESLSNALETINAQSEIIKGYESRIADLCEQISSFADSTPAPKSLRNSRPVERAFAKANDSEFEKGGMQDGQLRENQVSIKNRAAVSEILDQATFAKGGYDEEFSKACTAFEAGAQLPASILRRIKTEFGIEIVG